MRLVNAYSLALAHNFLWWKDKAEVLTSSRTVLLQYIVELDTFSPTYVYTHR